jgi:hypothetical protein
VEASRKGGNSVKRELFLNWRSFREIYLAGVNADLGEPRIPKVFA